MPDIVNNAYLDLIATFLDPRKRIFWGYLVCAFLIGLFYWIIAHNYRFRDAVTSLLSKKVWWSASAKADYKILIINKILMLLISPFLLSQVALATFIFFGLYDVFPSRPQFLSTWSSVSIGLIFTAFYFVFDDFMRFYIHRLMHRWPVLWAFHKVHHSAQRLTPITVLRSHPVEAVIFSVRSVFVQALAIGLFVFFLGDKADLVTVYGAILFSFFFNMLGSNLRHSHVAIGYWKPLEKWFISPAQHQIHHSIAKEHWDKNYGVALSVWDRLFGSFCYSQKNQRLIFGVQGIKNHSLTAIYIEPVVESGILVKQFIIGLYCKFRSLFYRYSKVVMLWKY